ncbi:MAG: hypothetical protein VB086_10055 [Clostridiaceae bacterium]|nr:hypothetical protein [Clostridiaceae bacterium]
MSEDALAIISVLGTISSIAFAYFAFSRGRRRDDTQAGRHSGTILTEIGYIKSGIDEIRKKQELGDQRHIEIVSRLAAVEESVKQAHKRLDTLTEQGERRD